ncbi:MAG: hypothetical protein ACYDAJ_02820 [Nitrosotalea sp.]
MKTLHLSIIVTFTISVIILVFFTNVANAKPYQTNVITVGPKNLPAEIKNMSSCHNPHMDMVPSSIYTINDQGLKFILDNNPDLKNNMTSLKDYIILDKFFSTIEKKLVSESPEFQSLHGNYTSIVFGSQYGVGDYLSCGEVGVVGTFQTDSGEQYMIIFEMNGDYTYTFILYPDLGVPLSYKIPVKYLIITEVELSSKNGTQWVRIYDPTAYDIPLNSVYMVDSKVSGPPVFFDKNSIVKSGHDIVVQIPHGQPPDNGNWSNMNSIIIYPREQIFQFNPVTHDPTSNIRSMYWDKTPLLNDTFSDSRTWQYNGTGWVFTDKQVAIPEFPLAMPVLLISIASLIVFYRIKSSFEI